MRNCISVHTVFMMNVTEYVTASVIGLFEILKVIQRSFKPGQNLFEF